MVLYYVQLNIVCLLLLIGVYANLRGTGHSYTSRVRAFEKLVYAAILMCVSDMAAGAARGQSFDGARLIIQISNMAYFEAIVWVGYTWLVYVDLRIHGGRGSRRKFALVSAVPFAVISVLILLNPVTNCFFSVNSRNLYERGEGVLLHWIVSWGYLLWATGICVVAMIREKTKVGRAELRPLLFFVAAPIVASVCQMIFYGVSAMQCGVTLSVMLIMSKSLNEKVQRDALTGLNNRGALTNYLRELPERTGSEIYIFMLDIDDFKKINDAFGHLEGDKTLKLMARVLKDVCGEGKQPLFLCRYGGDEFVIVGRGMEQAEIKRLFDDLDIRVNRVNSEGSLKADINFSIGSSKGLCDNMRDAEELLEAADRNMYREKNSKMSISK